MSIIIIVLHILCFSFTVSMVRQILLGLPFVIVISFFLGFINSSLLRCEPLQTRSKIVSKLYVYSSLKPEVQTVHEYGYLYSNRTEYKVCLKISSSLILILIVKKLVMIIDKCTELFSLTEWAISLLHEAFIMSFFTFAWFYLRIFNHITEQLWIHYLWLPFLNTWVPITWNKHSSSSLY